MHLELEREQTVQTLCRQFAHDNLTTQDLELRLEAAYRATTAAELQALTAGLPAVRASTGEVTAVSATRSGGMPRARRIVTVFGSARRRGDWEVAEYTRAVAIFAELVLDLRDAAIPAGISTIDVSAMFGAIRIIVPPGLFIECDGSAVFGAFTERTSMSAAPDSGAPTLRITGKAMFGEVKIVTRLPDSQAVRASKTGWSD